MAAKGYIDDVHHIQRHILKLLIGNTSQRYSQLRPKQVEPNQFVYHLKQLIKEDLVAKCGEGYELTARGRSFADKLDHAAFVMPWETQPRVVLFLAVRAADGRWLLLKRDKQPTIGRIGFISTDMAVGEPIAETAGHYIHAAFGMAATFSYAGSGSITLYRNDELESYVVYHLLAAESAAGAQAAGLSDPRLGWYDTGDLADPLLLPSTAPLLESIKASRDAPLCTELIFTLDV